MILLIAAVGGVTAAIYWTGVQTVKQKVTYVATGEVVAEPITLPDIEEMATATYDENTHTPLDKALIVQTKKVGENLKVTLEASSSLDNYTSYSFELIVDTTPSGSSLSGTVLTITKDGLPLTDIVALDVAGIYKFDYRFTVTVGQLDADVEQTFDFKFEVEMV